jgi:YD repeat-containing protein
LTGVSGTINKTFTYDQLGRLTGENETGSAPRAFGYDLAGNLGGNATTFTPTNQYPLGSGMTYDADGNTLSKNIGLGGIYTYDSAGHVLTQKLSNVPNSPTIMYAYDNMGRRVKRTVGGVTDGDRIHDHLSHNQVRYHCATVTIFGHKATLSESKSYG